MPRTKAQQLSNLTSPAAKAKRAASLKKLWSDPARKAERIAKMKEGRAKARRRRGLSDYGPIGSEPARTEDPGSHSGQPPAAESSAGPAKVETVTVGSELPPPDLKTSYMVPPSSLAPVAPKPEKEKLWQPREASPAEANELVNAFVRLELKGFDCLAVATDWDGWHHEESEMDPDRVIWRYVLKRIKFDPGLILVALACIEIAEREGVRAAQYSKVAKARPKVPDKRSAPGGGVDPQAQVTSDISVLAPT